jgi:PncC family amidohydrolase
LASRITDVPGASEVFQKGFVTYSNAAKTQILGVPADLLERHGAVSPEVAAAMAVAGRLPVQQIDIASLQGKLRDLGQKLAR